MFTSEAYTLQGNTTTDGKFIIDGELYVKAQYLCFLHVDTNWCWKQHPQHHVITVTTRTILHPQIEVNAVTYSHTIPKRLCNRTQERKAYQDSLYISLILTMIIYYNNCFVETKLSLKEM